MIIRIDEAKEGMIILTDVYDEYGKILLSSGVRLSNKFIDRLKKEKVYEIDVREQDVSKKRFEYLEEEEIIENSKVELKKFGRPEVKEKVTENCNKLEDIIKKLFINNNLDSSKRKAIIDSVVKFIKQNFNKDIIYILEYITKDRVLEGQLYYHSLNVAILSYTIGKWLKYTDKQLDVLITAALFHDIGKIKIPEEILNKEERLLDNEYEIIMSHAKETETIMKEFGCFSKEIIEAASFHHERVDGSGYPNKLKSQDINEYSKIIAVADIFDALTSRKPYREKYNSFKALEIIDNYSYSKLDNKITKLFITKFFEIYLGQGVELNDSTKAKIIRLNSNEITRPLLATTDGQIIDLALRKELEIQKFL
ncbi:MAG: hypothetical protein PWP46_2151 [Fusobacteriaceae bacterium]|jgi:putative nucleotidyltransferase with HDIG domain|nr:hypothetical protein [Fusobacteriales bacterium]MDN5305264.1 hypothetical protein [Fusobacteriaceae bacterium]